MTNAIVVVMGVSASGKSSLGARLAESIHAPFIDGDDLHPAANIQKMASGQPLDDSDRLPWLAAIRDSIHGFERSGSGGVIVCSALKKQYRDQIREGSNALKFLFLDGSYDLIMQRIQVRSGHFMKDTLLRSQFEILERPVNEPDVFTVAIDGTLEDILAHSLKVLKLD